MKIVRASFDSHCLDAREIKRVAVLLHGARTRGNRKCDGHRKHRRDNVAPRWSYANDLHFYARKRERRTGRFKGDRFPLRTPASVSQTDRVNCATKIGNREGNATKLLSELQAACTRACTRRSRLSTRARVCNRAVRFVTGLSLWQETDTCTDVNTIKRFFARTGRILFDPFRSDVRLEQQEPRPP